MISNLLWATALGIWTFAATNIDDLVVLAAFFSEPDYQPQQVVIGQYIGFTTLLVISLICAQLAFFIPAQYLGLLGVFPIGLGIKELLARREDELESVAPKIPSSRRANILAVASITIADCGDNIAIYVPLFATRSILETGIIAVTFMLLTGCLLLWAYYIVSHHSWRVPIRRIGTRVFPWVLIALGIYIMGGSIIPLLS